MKILIYFAHPRPDRSEVNVHLFEAARKIEGISIIDLYAEYPTFDVDVDREQKRLLEHDAIVLQHPVYWYSAPALLKEWQDQVLEHGFAYGDNGYALAGKVILNAVTCGGSRAAYSKGGACGEELRSLFSPFQKTFELCRMRYLAPFAVYAAGHAAQQGRLGQHISDYQRLLRALASDRLDLRQAEKAMNLTDDLDAIILEEMV